MSIGNTVSAFDSGDTREQQFSDIRSAISTRALLSSPTAIVAKGDSLAILREVPGHSVSLILTDPPYHATKKQNIYGDTAFAEDKHYLEWMREYAIEWHRVLKPNGSLFCFCDSSMSSRLDVLFSTQFNILSHVVWTKPNEPGFDGWKGKMKKEALRQWYPHSERILFAEPAANGNLFRAPFANMLRDARKKSGLSMHALTAIIGEHGAVNHGGAVSNWEAGRNTPSKEQYVKICRALIGTGHVQAMPSYEDAIRVFNMDSTKQFTDVWTFPSVRPYKGKHPAEKPAEMLEHAIEATTMPGDIVLDCFAGSGSSIVAALKLGRRAVAMEIESTWASRIAIRVEQIIADGVPPVAAGPRDHTHTRSKRKNPQLSLFSGGK